MYGQFRCFAGAINSYGDPRQASRTLIDNAPLLSTFHSGSRLRREESRTMPAHPPSRSPDPGAGKILVIDDDQNVLDLISTILEKLGYRVETARNSQSALSKARSTKYDLVILDLILPDADGVILHGKLKKISPGIEGRTIFMTGFTSEAPVIDYLK